MKHLICYLLMLIASIANAQNVMRNTSDPYGLIGYYSKTYNDYDLAAEKDSAVNDLSFQIQALSSKIAALSTEKANLKRTKIESMLQKDEVMITYYVNCCKINRATIVQDSNITTTVKVLLDKKVIKTVEGYTSRQVISFEGKGDWLSIDIIGKDGKSLKIVSEYCDCSSTPQYTETYSRYNLASEIDSTVHSLSLQIQELSTRKSLLEKQKIELKAEKIDNMLKENEVIITYFREPNEKRINKVMIIQNPNIKTAVIIKYDGIPLQTIVGYTSQQMIPVSQTNVTMATEVVGIDGKYLTIIREYAVIEE